MAEEDLIFGKNRHFFGGIEPDNLKEFSAIIEDGVVNLNVVLPDDTVIDGQTLCTIAGAVIRRKTNGFPKNEFDGDFVADVSESMYYIDSSAVPTEPYYYAAFPYTTQGVYNRNKENRTTINTTSMTISAETPYITTAKINFTIPAGFTGVVVRKGIDGYPETETDGEEVGTYTSSGNFNDTDVVDGGTYLYSFFLYDAEGNYVYDDRNRISVTMPKQAYFYGYDLKTSTSNPSTRVTYPSGVDNYGFTPAKMNFNTSLFESGSWDLTPGRHFMPRPCMLGYDGKILYYLNPNNYEQKEDGSASDIINATVNGNAMMEWPKIYTKRWESGGVYHFRCSNVRHDSDWDCWCNYDRNNNIIEHFYTPIYAGYVIDGRLRSLSDKSPSSSYGASEEIAYATANGSDWYTEVLADRLLIQDLLVLIGKSTNGQSTFGYGWCDASSRNGTGNLNDKGLFWGENEYQQSVKVFGMEDFWGNVTRRIAGWINASGTHKVKLTRGTHDGSTVSDYNTTGNGYISAGSAPTSSGYINSNSTKNWGRLPTGRSGSSSTYECDYVYGTGSGTNYAYVGGYWSDALRAGPFFAHLYDTASVSGTRIGASISCKPLAAT